MGSFLGKILLFNFKNKGNLGKWSESGRMSLDGICRNGNPLQCSLAWRIPRTEELGRLQSMGLQRVRHDCVTFTFRFHCPAKDDTGLLITAKSPKQCHPPGTRQGLCSRAGIAGSLQRLMSYAPASCRITGRDAGPPG